LCVQFIDAGFSYTTDTTSGFSTTDENIADNLVLFLIGFFQLHPEYATSRFFIASESYGGKMASVTGVALHKALLAKRLQVNFRGVMLGDGWVGPVLCMASYGQYLLALSLVTPEQAQKIDAFAVQAQQGINDVLESVCVCARVSR
jgi:serine carboxypeptidase 1